MQGSRAVADSSRAHHATLSVPNYWVTALLIHEGADLKLADVVWRLGVRADGKVIIAISQEAVSFDSFARLFRDGVKCPNALFLDGDSASSLFVPTLNRFGNLLPLGPMLAVFENK